MQYIGDVYGKIGRKYLKLGTTKEVCSKKEVIKEIEKKILELRDEYKGMTESESVGAGSYYTDYEIRGLEFAREIIEKTC